MMRPIPEGELDLVAVGEVLLDFISEAPAERLEQADRFRRYLGGSVTNVAANLVRLGSKAAVVAKTGDDAFGRYIRHELARRGVITDYLLADPRLHTSVVFITRSAGTADFILCRGADACLEPADVPEELIAQARVVHASSFALSQEPSRSAVLKALRLARERGSLVSLDPNYHPALWGDDVPVEEVLAEAYRFADVAKPSWDDCQRLFGPGLRTRDYVDRFHRWGVPLVVLTRGPRGVLISHEGKLVDLASRDVTVSDATGAGDAFWAGFLAAMLDGRSLYEAALVGREVAELKLTTVGQLAGPIDKEALYQRIAESR